jgi:hypothetical protein
VIGYLLRVSTPSFPCIANVSRPFVESHTVFKLRQRYIMPYQRTATASHPWPCCSTMLYDLDMNVARIVIENIMSEETGYTAIVELVLCIQKSGYARCIIDAR